jgi:hypothetical protein
VISESFDITKDGNTVLYVFNFENGGFVIVSADDRFTPIIGYAPDGFYEKDNMPDGFEFLMEEFSEMIVFIQEKNIATKPEYTEKWERYTSDEPVRDITATVVVEPMTVLWNQDTPYNYYCPTVNGGRTYAGCVATAMSMIMHYWRWPWQGTGKQDVYRPALCKGVKMDTLSANFGATFYDYNGMYGTPKINADGYLYEPLSLLQYHAGVAVKMNYCTDGSGAQSASVPNAMKKFFKYDPSIQYVDRKSYANTEEWGGMIKEQLLLKQPVYVSGCPANPNGDCHAFVCDGYRDDNMFHYNFGWSGSGNAYFISDQPGEFVNQNYLAAVINFIPDRSQDYPLDCNGNWTIHYMKGMLADCSGSMENYAAGTTATWLIDPSAFGDAVENITISYVEMDLASGDFLEIYDADNDGAPVLGKFTGKDSFEPIKTNGSKVFVKFTSAASSPTAQGFLITYEATPKKYCVNDITLTNSTGTFTDGSPEEMNYPNSASCKWFIFPDGVVDPETEISFEFTRLDTEGEADVIKFYDYGHNILTPVAIISGTEIPLPISIKTNKVMINFSSGAYINGKGFEIKYSTSPVSIKEVENINDLSIYPNPTSDRLNIQFNTSTADDFDITIYNVTGQAVYKETLNRFLGSYHQELNTADFAQGVYLMQIKSSKGTITRKVVVQ